MNNKLSYGCLLIAAGFTVFSCSQEEQMDELNFSRVQTSAAIQANVEDFVMTDGTRVNVDINTLGISFRWAAGDALGIFAASSPEQQVKYSIQQGEGTNEAVFANDMDFALNPGSQYAAYYPYCTSPAPKASGINAAYSGQAIAGNGSTSHLGKFDYLASTMTSAEADGSIAYQMKHMGSLVRFRLTMPEADSYSSFSLTSRGRQLIRQGKMSIVTSEPCFAEADSAKTLTFPLSATSTTESDKVLTLYVMMAPEDYSQSDWALTVMGSKNAYVKNIKGASMKAGNAYSYDATLVAHEAVDLGVVVNGKKVLWANMNVGATGIEEYGDYFAWGESVPYGQEDMSNVTNYHYHDGTSHLKLYYDWISYKYCSSTRNNLTKYVTSEGSSFGKNDFYDNKTVLEPEDDAATANWGGDWRMPTFEELKALKAQCTWKWMTSYNGVDVKGYEVSGNGKTIFLPATGWRERNTRMSAGIAGIYWSSTVRDANPYLASRLSFSSSEVDAIDNYSRYAGQSVRPVLPGAEYVVFVSSIVLNKSAITLEPKDTEKLIATVTPSNAESRVTWSSSNESIASVDANGVVTAHKDGVATVTATTIDGSGKKAQCTVTVKSPDSGIANGHEWVDLGVVVGGKKVLWATCNVGATAPENYGSYFAWGETVPYGGKDEHTPNYADPYSKPYYNWETYKYCKDDEKNLTKYVPASQAASYGYNSFYDNKTTLEPEDDAATANWGEDWRTPTYDELIGLLEQCTWTWTTTYNGKSGPGFKVSGNGHEIFLPEAGNCTFNTPSLVSCDGFYWSSTLCESSPYSAWFLGFNSGGIIPSNYPRRSGLNVRPVLANED